MFVEYDQVIQTLPSDAANQPFNMSPLPRGTWLCQHLLNAHSLHLIDELMAEGTVSIAQQMPRCGVPRERFAQLVSRPLGRRMCCDREVKDAPTFMRQHQEHIQNLKPNGGHGEEIDGDKALQMILQERAPGL